MSLVVGLGMTPVITLAHPGLSAVPGTLDLILHPFTGVDHLVAMIVVGVALVVAFRFWKTIG